MTSKGNTLTIQMHSDHITTRTGFKVSYVISGLEAKEGMGRPIICFHYGLMCIFFLSCVSCVPCLTFLCSHVPWVDFNKGTFTSTRLTSESKFLPAFDENSNGNILTCTGPKFASSFPIFMINYHGISRRTYWWRMRTASIVNRDLKSVWSYQLSVQDGLSAPVQQAIRQSRGGVLIVQ